ncbi:transposase [Trabulsiella guamensis ATCC 49490]|uniref:Transposase n=2 Tax=Enterobacteriaceae TaxID=543 RepID=A0A085A812_9ENTR|nr:transposase [Trabulsiella guamensis ATCC 49490]
MTLNTSQVSYYMTQRKKGVTQHISAMKAGISVRSGRRIEKDQWSKAGVRHWRTRKDPLEAVWDSMLVPLLKERPALMPTTLLEMLQDKYPGQYPNSLRRTMQRRVREWKLQYGAEQEVMFRQWHQPGLRGLSDFTELKGVVVTIAGKLLAHKLYHFRLEWSHWSWMRVVLGGESFSALAEGLQEALGQLGGVSDLSLYPGTFHQSPDSVDSALLPGIPQIQMDLAITIDASRLQPELFNLSCQSQVCLMAL